VNGSLATVTQLPSATRCATVLRRPSLAVGAGAVAVAACGGAAGLAFGFLGLPAELEARLPLESPVLGGLALLLIVAVPCAVLAVAAARGSAWTDQAAVVAGGLLVGWIVVQLAFIRTLSFFHPFFIAVGIAFVVAGRGALRRPPFRRGAS
jgi:hypothetical protein